MGKRPDEDVEHMWPCGRCGHKTPYEDDEPPTECENCEYQHGGRDHKDVPDEIRLKIHS